jgi:hypothetical protein
MSDLVAELKASGDDLSMADVVALLTAAIRLAVAKSEQDGTRIAISGDEVTATEVVVVARALLDAQHLNTFDLELWSAGPPTDLEG